MNSGDVDDTVANPSLVTAGIKFFTPAGVALDPNSDVLTAADSFMVVQGDTENLRKSTTIKCSDIVSMDKQIYVAPTAQVSSIASLPAASEGDEYKVSVLDLSVNPGFEQVTAHFIAEGSMTAAEVITELADQLNAIERGVVSARSNKITTIALTGTSGTANVGIAGTNYLATFNSNLDTTATDFVTAHAAAILANHGITVTATTAGAANDLVFTVSRGNVANPTITNASGDLAGTVTATQAATLLILTAEDTNVSFSTALDGEAAAGVITVTTYPSPGSGSYAQVLELEKAAIGTYGRYYVEAPLLNHSPNPFRTYATSGGQYHIYTVNVKTTSSGTGLGAQFHQTYQVFLCFEDSTSNDIDAMFDNFIV